MTLKEMVPWRWGGLRRWDDEDRPFESFFREMDSLHKEMDRLFEDFWKGSGRHAMTAPWQSTMAQFPHGEVMPRVDETEDEKAFHIEVELPGMDRDDVDITLSNSLLTIRGEKKREQENIFGVGVNLLRPLICSNPEYTPRFSGVTMVTP